MVSPTHYATLGVSLLALSREFRPLQFLPMGCDCKCTAPTAKCASGLLFTSPPLRPRMVKRSAKTRVLAHQSAPQSAAASSTPRTASAGLTSALARALVGVMVGVAAVVAASY